MNLYDVEKTFEALMNKIYKGHTYEVLVGQEMSDTILIFKAVTLLANIAMLNQDICEWSWMNKHEKKVEKFKIFPKQAWRKLQKTLKTAGKSNYTVAISHVKEINNVPSKE